MIVLGFLVASMGAAPKDDALRKDLQQLQGTWLVDSMEMDGKFMSDETRKKIKLVINGENFRFHTGDDSHAGLYKLDPSKDQKELNIVITEGDEKGKVYLVVYKFEDGKMIQCMELSNKGRPKTFTGKAGSGCALEIWTREQP